MKSNSEVPVKKVRRAFLALGLLAAVAMVLALSQGCSVKTPTVAQYLRLITPTMTPTPAVTVVCYQMFNACDTLTDNGTWAGTSATRTASILHVTQGTGSMRVNITTPAAWNDQIMVLTGFTPADWAGITRVSMDVYVDPSVVNGASYSQFVLFGDSDWPVSKYYQLLAVTPPNLVAGAQTLTWVIDRSSGTLLPGDPITKLTFVHNRSACGPGEGIGNIYVDNIRINICP